MGSTKGGAYVVCRAKTALGISAQPDTEGLAQCKDASSYYASNSVVRVQCGIVRQNCWSVPLNSSDYFSRCIWQRDQSVDSQIVCEAPAALKNKTKTELLAAGKWSQCITATTTTTSVTVGEAQSNPFLDIFFTSAQQFGRFMADIENALPVIVICGAGVAFIMGLVWLVFIRVCGGFMVWLTVWTTIVAAIIVTIVAYFRAGILTKALVNDAVASLDTFVGVNVTVSLPSQVTESSTDMKRQWSYFAYAMTAFSVILLFIILWMRKSINIAIGVIKEASGARWGPRLGSCPCN